MMPIVRVRARWSYVDGVWGLTHRCDRCRQTHHHGGGRGVSPDGGLRVRHCDGAAIELVVTEIEDRRCA